MRYVPIAEVEAFLRRLGWRPLEDQTLVGWRLWQRPDDDRPLPTVIGVRRAPEIRLSEAQRIRRRASAKLR